jgi:hypothetical protein
MQTFWMTSEQNRVSPDPSKADHVLHSLEDLPRILRTLDLKVPA